MKGRYHLLNDERTCVAAGTEEAVRAARRLLGAHYYVISNAARCTLCSGALYIGDCTNKQCVRNRWG